MHVLVSASMHLVFLHVVFMSQEGEIWPNIPVELNIVFKPEEAKLYQETIYCDVAGECLSANYSKMKLWNPFDKTVGIRFHLKDIKL